MVEEPALHRIAKLLARAGVASRRDVERMIEDGRVALNGTMVDTPATLLASLDGITVDGEPVAEAEPTRLFLFHKPAGYLTAARDPLGRPTIYDRLPADLPRLVPVGRLDLNTEGLLLLTTDGAFKRQLELPSTGVERAYRARAYGDVTQAQLEELIDGVEIDGIRYGSIDANLERRTGANVWVEMILTEGKNREVRNVLEYLGLQVSRLIRTRYGPFLLGDLPVGGIGEVRAADLVGFRHSLKDNARLAPEQAGTITATAIRPGSIARAASASRRADHRAGAAGAAEADRSQGYDPMRAHTPSDSDRVPTRGAFGSRPARAAPGDDVRGSRAAPSGGERTIDRTTGNRASSDRTGDQGRAHRRHGVNEPDGSRSRRPDAAPRPSSAAPDDRSPVRPDQSARPDRGSDRAGSRNRSGSIDPTHAARPFRDTAARGNRTPQRPDDRGPRALADRASPDRGRSQQPGRHAPDTRPAKSVVPRGPNRDEVVNTPRPARPERKAGWARAKPKPGARPGKPRK